MAIIKDHNLIFFHVPKTGGNSICDFFDVQMFGHRHATSYIEIMGEKEFYSYKKFAAVRDPIGRFISAYKHLKRSFFLFQSQNDASVADAKKYEQLDLNNFEWNINEFVLTGRLKFVIEKAFTEFNGMAVFLSSIDQDTKQGVLHHLDYILRTERLEEDLQRMLKLEGIDIPRTLNRLNPGSSAVEPFYPEVIKIIEECYHVDYHMLDLMWEKKMFAFQKADS